MPVIREYETLYIVAPDLDEEAQQSLIKAVVEVAEKSGAEIIKNDIWGKRKLAYPIKKFEEGVYVLLRCKSAPSLPQDIDTFVKRTPGILRHLTTLVSKQQLKEEARLRAQEAKRVEEAAKREAEAAEEAAKQEAEAAAAAAETSAEQKSEEASAEQSVIPAETGEVQEKPEASSEETAAATEDATTEAAVSATEEEPAATAIDEAGESDKDSSTASPAEESKPETVTDEEKEVTGE